MNVPIRVVQSSLTVHLTMIVSPAANEPSHSTTVSPAGSVPQFASVALVVPAGFPVPESVGPAVIAIPDKPCRPVSTMVGIVPAANGSTAVKVAVHSTLPSRATAAVLAVFVSVESGATTQVVTVEERSLSAFGAFERSGEPVTVPSASALAPICASLL